MSYILLLGAGFSRNWGAPLSDEISGSLLGELHDDRELSDRLRSGPFEDAFVGLQRPRGNSPEAQRLKRLQAAVVSLFDRINTALARRAILEFSPSRVSVNDFLQKFDAIFTLNQDLLLEADYVSRRQSGKWSGTEIPGMTGTYPDGYSEFDGVTHLTWKPNGTTSINSTMQPYFKLHGSSNWHDSEGEPVLIMGSGKSGAIDRFPVLRFYHDCFRAILADVGAKLMVIGYSFQDKHINEVICESSAKTGLGVFLVDLAGREVLKDPKLAGAAIKWKRDVEDIKLIGELRRPMSAIFGDDDFALGELMRFFD